MFFDQYEGNICFEKYILEQMFVVICHSTNNNLLLVMCDRCLNALMIILHTRLRHLTCAVDALLV